MSNPAIQQSSNPAIQQSAISNQQSAISNQQSAISNQQSAISNSAIQRAAIDGPYLVPNNQNFLTLLSPRTRNFVDSFLESTSEHSRTSIDLPPSPIEPPSEGYITLRDSLQNYPVAFVSQQASENKTIFDTLTPEEKQALFFETVLAIVDRDDAGQLLTSLPENYLNVLKTPWIADTLLALYQLHEKDPELAAFEARLNGVDPASLPKFTVDDNFIDVLTDKVSSGAVQRQLENFLISKCEMPKNRVEKFLEAFQTTKEQLIAAIRTSSERAPLSVAGVVFAMEKLGFNGSDGDRDSLRAILNQSNIDGFVNSYTALRKHALREWRAGNGENPEEVLEGLIVDLERKPRAMMERIFGIQKWDERSLNIDIVLKNNVKFEKQGEYVYLPRKRNLSGFLRNCFILLEPRKRHDLSRIDIDNTAIYCDSTRRPTSVMLPNETRNVNLINLWISPRDLKTFIRQNHTGLGLAESGIRFASDNQRSKFHLSDEDRKTIERLRWNLNSEQRELFGFTETFAVDGKPSERADKIILRGDLSCQEICEMLNSLLSLGPREGDEGFMRLRFIAGPPLHNHILIVSRIKEEGSESSAKDPKFLVLFEDAEHARGIHDREVGIISAAGFISLFSGH